MKTLKRTLATLSALLVLTALRTLYLSGTFISLSPVNTGKEQQIKGMPGAEDIAIDPASGLALVSSDDRRKTRAGTPVRGAIYQVDFQTKPAKIRNLSEASAPADFHPHGISLFTDPSDRSKWLFVVNHPKAGPRIELFRYQGDTALVHVETIQDEAIKSPNDLVADSRRSFYFTNDHDVEGGVSSWKDFLVIGTGQVGYWDGEKAEILAKGIRYANGINLSPDGKRLYVAACTDRSILVFQRSPFQQIQRIKCGTAVDNLEWDEEGNLWAGAHPKMLAFLGHAQNPDKRSPSQVLRIDLGDPNAPIVETRYLNLGDPLSGSSVAVFYKGMILVGGVFDDGILLL
jgi:arylesterase/paraoxonase